MKPYIPAVIVAVYMSLVLYVIFGMKPNTAYIEQLQQREHTAVAFCLDNGGTAQFSYEQGADHLTFTGCTFTRGQQQQASDHETRIPGGKTL